MDGKFFLHKIEISSNLNPYNFDINTYKEERLKNIIKKEDYEKIIKDANNLIYKSLEKKKKNDIIVLPFYIKIFSLLSIFFSFMYVLCVLVQSFDLTNKNLTYYSQMEAPSVYISLVIISLLTILNFIRPLKKFKSVEKFFEENLTNYFNEYNDKYKDVMEFVYNPNKNNLELLIYKEEFNEGENLDNNNEVENDINISNRSNSNFISENQKKKNKNNNNNNNNNKNQDIELAKLNK
jgi:hypothetical protein